MQVVGLEQPAPDRVLVRTEKRPAWLAAGGMLGAFASMSCCILPLVLFSLGIGGAWIGYLTALAPYQPIFVAITLAFLGAGFWLAYLRPKRGCAEGEACARPLPGRIVKTGLWLASGLVAAALAFPYVAPALLGT
ncbi:MAG TPA: mercuric transporter MerT family protein [Geminicoccaceae bacterium]|jgi:mercuric ion transport protein|nr:mercuric transporter MerT family protein [Geminicoccaceae bacterium]